MEESEISQFTALMKEMSKEIDSNQLSDSKIETFYAFCSKALICFFKESEKSSTALSVLLTFLKEDERVFARFKPNKLILRKMKLDRMLKSESEEEVNIALDFSSFVCRYNPDIQYKDFSENEETVEIIKRGESFRSWGDIEDLTNSYDALLKNFTEHEKTVGNAFQELYNHIEKVKEQLNEKIKENKNDTIRINNAVEILKDLSKNTRPNADDEILQIKSALGKVDNIEKITETFDKKMDQIEAFINEKVIKRIDQLERHEDEMTTQVQNFSNKVKVEMEKSAKMEDQLKEQLEIISTVNKKANNNHKTFEEVKNLIHNKINRVEQLIINKENEEVPTHADLKAFFETVKKLEEQLVAMKTYQNELDEVFSLQSKEMDSLIKLTANNNYIKIREIETTVDTTKNKLIANQNMMNIQLAEVLKDMDAVKRNRKKIESLEWAQDETAKLEVLIADTEQLWNFIQGFIDEQSITQSKCMNSTDRKLTERMDALEWVSRNAIYLTQDALNNCINTFKNQYNSDNQTLTNAYIFSSHNSDIITTILGKLEYYLSLKRDDETEKKICSQLAILEPVLINDMNLEVALNK